MGLSPDSVRVSVSEPRQIRVHSLLNHLIRPDQQRGWNGEAERLRGLQRLYFADEVQDSGEIDRGAAPKIRDQERTLAEQLISELATTEFHPENTRTSTASGF
jgi:hypothetical protein